MPELASIADPQLSPDGHTIAFVTAVIAAGGENGRQQIHRVDAGGGRPTPLTSGADSAWSPRWSPDGRRLAFLAARTNDTPPQIHVLEIESGASRRVTTHPTPPGDLTWAPDSRLIFFTAVDAFRPARRHLSVVDLDGVTTQITFGDFAVLDYALSPSGGTIAMTRAQPVLAGARGERDLWVMDANGGNAHRLTIGADFARRPQVSPDGASVVFLAPRPSGAGAPGGDTLFVVPRRGGQPRALDAGGRFSVREAQWLSDGHVAMVADQGGVVRVWEIDVPSGRMTPRTPDVRAVGHWTVHRPSSSHVFTAQVGSQSEEIYLLPTAQPMRLVSRIP